MSDAEKASAADDARRAAAEPFIRLACLGAESWNRWIRTVVDDEQAKALGIEAIEKFIDAQLRELMKDAGIKALPEIGLVGGERRGAVFDGVDFSKIKDSPDFAGFAGFAFPAPTSFAGARFGDEAHFEGASFGEGANFRETIFGIGTNFEGALFGDGSSFVGARFGENARFDRARFGDRANFEGARFGDRANFEGASFGNRGRFVGARFAGDVSFEAGYEDDWNKRLVSLGNSVGWGSIKGGRGISDFLNVRRAKFPGNPFTALSFGDAIFAGRAEFTGRHFLGPLTLRNAHFEEVPEFANTEGAGNIDPSGMRISFQGSIPIPVLSHVRGALASLAGVVPRRPIRKSHLHWTADSEVSARIRRLRKIMADIHAHDIERDLFILEKKADRGVLWALGGFRNRWKSIGWTLLLAVYGALSYCGRSLLWPIAWLGATWLSFQALYRHLMNGTRSCWDADLASFTLGNMLPFASGLNPARKDVLARLFSRFDPFLGWTIEVPLSIELASIAQGTLGAVLLFLLLLAIRNRFKIG